MKDLYIDLLKHRFDTNLPHVVGISFNVHQHLQKFDVMCAKTSLT